ncbi:sulfate anion transporter 1-like isoform X2 [Dreissena polymorpha]|nr:sulfate anion transporter 1-like isoform X2 [Dreissena polymorpha]
MNKDPQVHVVLDVDGTTPPITVISGEERQYYDTLQNRCKKTAVFRRDYRLPDEPPLGFTAVLKRYMAACCSAQSRRNLLSNRFPVWRTMKKYKWRTDLPNDIVSGLTVGIMQLPQGMAYALLAELPPVVGLYMAFFPVLMYFIFGTSRHVSMGTVALISLLTGSVVSRFYDPSLASAVLGANQTEEILHNMTIPDNAKDEPIEVELPDHVKINIAASICLLVGLAQMVMGLLKMGFITTYMSDPLIGGFTTGAAVHVGTSQVKYALGLHIPRSDGVFQIPKTYALVFRHIGETSVPTLVVSLICMVVLYIVKEQINQRFKSKLRFPIPVELFVVIGATLASHFMNFAGKYHIKTVGKIPPGLPTPTVPSFPSPGVYSADVFIIALVAFSQCVSLVALFAKKHGYSYDSNQELIAYGLGNIFSSFFSCYPYAASVSRSSVQESAGGKTQLASVVSAVMVLIVILSIGPLFESLPNCALASIILVALKGLFMQFQDLPQIYRISVYDFLIWVVTFLAVVLLHVDFGILVGMLFSFFTVVLRAQRTKAVNLQKISDLYVYENSAKYKQTESVSGVRVVGFNSPVYYANGDLFVKQVYHAAGVVPEKRLKMMKRMKRETENEIKETDNEIKQNAFVTVVNESKELGSILSLEKAGADTKRNGGWLPVLNGSSMQNNMVLSGSEEGALHHIVIDMAHVCFVDSVGAKVLKQLFLDYEAVKITVLFCCVNDEVWRVLDETGFLAEFDDRIYLNVDDAVNAIMLQSVIQRASEIRIPAVSNEYKENLRPDAQESDSLLELKNESKL